MADQFGQIMSDDHLDPLIRICKKPFLLLPRRKIQPGAAENERIRFFVMAGPRNGYDAIGEYLGRSWSMGRDFRKSGPGE